MEDKSWSIWECSLGMFVGREARALLPQENRNRTAEIEATILSVKAPNSGRVITDWLTFFDNSSFKLKRKGTQRFALTSGLQIVFVDGFVRLKMRLVNPAAVGEFREIYEVLNMPVGQRAVIRSLNAAKTRWKVGHFSDSGVLCYSGKYHLSAETALTAFQTFLNNKTCEQAERRVSSSPSLQLQEQPRSSPELKTKSPEILISRAGTSSDG